MKYIIKILFTMLSVGLSNIAFSSQYSTYVINVDEKSDRGYFIDYTICSDVLENNPTCSDHKYLKLWSTPVLIKLKDQKEMVYVWQAGEINWGDASGDYSKEVKIPGKKAILVSDCAVNSSKFITINSYGTPRIGCQIIVGRELS